MSVEPVRQPCQCARCTEPVIEHDKHGIAVMNNLHGKLRPCEVCGRAKTEYRDYGTRGEYRCWWCIVCTATGDVL